MSPLDILIPIFIDEITQIKKPAYKRVIQILRDKVRTKTSRSSTKAHFHSTPSLFGIF